VNGFVLVLSQDSCGIGSVYAACDGAGDVECQLTRPLPAAVAGGGHIACGAAGRGHLQLRRAAAAPHRAAPG